MTILTPKLRLLKNGDKINVFQQNGQLFDTSAGSNLESEHTTDDAASVSGFTSSIA